MYRCERGGVGNVLNSVVFPRRSKSFIFKSIDTPLKFHRIKLIFY